MSKEPKDFKNENPAMAFISEKLPEVENIRENVDFERNKPPRGYKKDPKYIETKSRRFTVLLQPSVFERLKNFAFEKHISISEAINEALQRYLKPKS